MVVFPTSKINIGLQITEKRPDGFHNLLSCFYPVGWGDVLELIPADTFSFSASGIPIDGPPEKNLCVRAYNALSADFKLPPVHLHLHKLVPIGAGLGGGSADAAFVLKMLNERFGLGLSVSQLEDYARPIGSDCAFFIQNRPLYCVEKGDVFKEIAVNLAGYHIVLIYPDLAISTAEAYAGVVPEKPAIPLDILLTQPIQEWRHTVINDFERSLFPRYPVLQQVKNSLYDLGAVYASMSGSGSTIYGIFASEPELNSRFSHYTVWQGKLL
ncbi:4-(cytidine 5'-diphospho)-2-C-methyl-D-erythritol kinase [Arsenicibacter rosenii]|uniref:4-diphosphocytidyl-2-C-methyl-D-erythritol kinase n=1 Tax=Arsenicibacter rosenii TaxID=1750698 RepID=A0A1S2VMN8_9BACT|nr:4-(cytidine 5'-diphospho)-2-C-methyl-D-erythritol kinase [Arsenicibacter rosenii]OIN60037.1 4-(cytidine 5'-diphospho)-2-C-methyl-D-erythritol kinase [Arsenicibacter rosenii]